LPPRYDAAAFDYRGFITPLPRYAAYAMLYAIFCLR